MKELILLLLVVGGVAGIVHAHVNLGMSFEAMTISLQHGIGSLVPIVVILFMVVGGVFLAMRNKER